MTDREKAIVMAYTGACMLTGDKFQVFHKYVEEIMGRPVQTIEMGFIADEIKEKSKADFMKLCADENLNEWIPVSERLPETDNKNEINGYNVLLWVANKTHPEREPQIYLGKLRKVNGDDGSGNFWGIETKPCDWTIWGWSYFNEPEVIAWMPLPKPYRAENEE